jgi:hypothetical protein
MIRFDSAIDAQTWLDHTAAGDCSLLTRQNRWGWIAGELTWLCRVPGGGPGCVLASPVVEAVATRPRKGLPIKLRKYRGAYARRYAAEAAAPAAA